MLLTLLIHNQNTGTATLKLVSGWKPAKQAQASFNKNNLGLSMSLVLHIGHAKCASTYLQEKIFPNIHNINYLG